VTVPRSTRCNRRVAPGRLSLAVPSGRGHPDPAAGVSARRAPSRARICPHRRARRPRTRAPVPSVPDLVGAADPPAVRRTPGAPTAAPPSTTGSRSSTVASVGVTASGGVAASVAVATATAVTNAPAARRTDAAAEARDATSSSWPDAASGNAAAGSVATERRGVHRGICRGQPAFVVAADGVGTPAEAAGDRGGVRADGRRNGGAAIGRRAARPEAGRHRRRASVDRGGNRVAAERGGYAGDAPAAVRGAGGGAAVRGVP